MNKYNPSTARRVKSNVLCTLCTDSRAEIWIDDNGYGLRICPCGYDLLLTSALAEIYSQDSYCPICDNHGTYHGPCPSCKKQRLPDTFILDFDGSKRPSKGKLK